MTPQEMHDAFTAGWMRGEFEQFDLMCAQLRSGELVMDCTEDGWVIRAADTECEPDS